MSDGEEEKEDINPQGKPGKPTPEEATGSSQVLSCAMPKMIGATPGGPSAYTEEETGFSSPEVDRIAKRKSNKGDDLASTDVKDIFNGGTSTASKFHLDKMNKADSEEKYQSAHPALAKSMKSENLAFAAEEEKVASNGLSGRSKSQNEQKFATMNSHYQSGIQKSNQGDNVTNKQH